MRVRAGASPSAFPEKLKYKVEEAGGTWVEVPTQKTLSFLGRRNGACIVERFSRLVETRRSMRPHRGAIEWNYAASSRAGIVNNNPVLVRDVLGEALV